MAEQEAVAMVFSVQVRTMVSIVRLPVGILVIQNVFRKINCPVRKSHRKMRAEQKLNAPVLQSIGSKKTIPSRSAASGNRRK